MNEVSSRESTVCTYQCAEVYNRETVINTILVLIITNKEAVEIQDGTI
jgi:hypothetical protein